MNNKAQKNKRNEEYSSNDDWKRWKVGWPYRGDAPNDPEYLKDRAKLLKENGNGWWRFVGYTVR